MTTMVAMDPFDSPMMDYISDDITMQVGPSSLSNPWGQPEATMEDDDQNTHFHTEDVEIEMEPYDPEQLEYEMTDEASVNHSNTDELLDVEVFDATRDLDIPPSLLDTNDMLPANDPLSSQQSPLSSAVDAHLVPEPLAESDALSSTFPGYVVDVPSQPCSEDQVEAVVLTEAEIQSIGHEESSRAMSSGPGESVQYPDDSVVNIRSQPFYADHDDYQQLTRLSPSAAVPTEEPNTTDNQETSPVGDMAQPNDESVFHEHWEDENQADAHESTADPHEISEGIYIDPPPAVLLSIPPSGDVFCLFNYPTTKSVTDDKSDSDLILLLHEFPTLYYEPLSKVFEGLRREAQIADGFDLANGELVIDAFELVDLTISEDNIHASEVSLHDLNILHDISDLPGPLHIRLECKTPRFIVRYRYLRSELERLNIDGEEKAEQSYTETTDQEDTKQTERPSNADESTAEQPSLTEPQKDDQVASIEQATMTHGSGDQDQPDHPDPSYSRTDHESEDYDDELDGEFDAEGDTDYGSQDALDAVETQDNAAIDVSAPVGNTYTTYEDPQEGKDEYDEHSNEDITSSKAGETVVIQDDVNDHHLQELVAETSKTLPLSTDLTSLESPAVVEHGGEFESDRYDPLRNTTLSEEPTSNFDDIASAENDLLVGSGDEKQVKAISPRVEGNEEDTHHTNPLSGSSKTYIQVISDADTLDDTNWNEEDLSGEFDEVEVEQDDESRHTDSSTKTSSGKTLSKRSFDELDSNDVPEASDPPEISSESKRQKML